ncbi:hypothetical protein [Streptomyces sp. ST2-7A]|uniref:hypothetical protein n=1 Tax=Streptomyces sp. ST2-7A TaxID=2907214 RepID=UPI001F47C156|nr:hypothetical protein [Streptomyces sp. ST2-7A]MCE7080614.1 hypothetical protein [Streptomyces sp. ST2-7A]
MRNEPGSPDIGLHHLETALEEALESVRGFPRSGFTVGEWLALSAGLGELRARTRRASAPVRQAFLGSARAALLAHLRARPGVPVSPAELEGVAGIREWTRRLRELRELGWVIDSDVPGPDGRRDHYRLSVDRLDGSVVEDDRLPEAVRGREPGRGVLEYLVHLSPWPADPARLARAAGTADWHPAVSALIRAGWPIRPVGEGFALAAEFHRRSANPEGEVGEPTSGGWAGT